MSFQTWVDEYDCESKHKLEATVNGGDKAMLRAALRKMEGLKRSNLDRHDLKFTRSIYSGIPGLVYGNMGMWLMREDTCPTCYVYRNEFSDEGCARCPVVKRTGRTCYDSGGFMGDGMITGDFSQARSTLRAWWREMFPESPTPVFWPSDVRKVSVLI